MFPVDVDAHIDESEATWEYREEVRAASSRSRSIPTDDNRPHRLWLIEHYMFTALKILTESFTLPLFHQLD